MADTQIETPQDAVEAFGVEQLVNEMDISDVLNCYSDDEIFNECNETDMADYLQRNRFDFSSYVDDSNDDIEFSEEPKINLLIEFCRQVSPHGILMKEDMQRIISEYIESLPNKCYSVYYNNPYQLDF